jgi:hypothetical protein
MRTSAFWILSMALLMGGPLSAQTSYTFTNFIRQVQMPSGVEWELSNINATGEQQSGLSVADDGARFELWTIKSNPLTSYLLDSKFVGSYIPSASITIRSEDDYEPIRRTRADRPFWVDVKVAGLSSSATAQAAARSVNFLHHVQPYGTGTGINLDRQLASLLTQVSINGNTEQTFSFRVSIPAADLRKARGEERFSIFSIADILSPSSQLASQYIQIWPMSDGVISNLEEGSKHRGKIPPITVTGTDLYPGSYSYLQVYKGTPEDGKVGEVVSSSVIKADVNKPTTESRVVELDKFVDTDGTWTVELLTETSFDIMRLDRRSFTVNRNLRVNSMLGTRE